MFRAPHQKRKRSLVHGHNVLHAQKTNGVRRFPRPHREMSPRDLDLAEIVAAIPNNCSWEEWNRIGMAIFAASGGSGDGRIVWDDFSTRSHKYNPRAAEERWRNYHRSPPSRTGIGMLAALAREAGWQPRDRGHAA